MQEYVRGFVLAQDSVHGKPTWKIRIKQPGDEFNGKKCRVASVHDGYTPQQSDDVQFVLGSTVEGGQRVLLAYNVSPFVEKEGHETATPNEDSMNWFITESGGKLHVSCIGDADVFRDEIKWSESDKIVAFIPFNIEEHLDKYDDDDVEGGFDIVRSLTYVPATREALEKLITAIVREAVKQKLA